MILIAESGGTKTNWCAVSGSEETGIVPTIGLNPNFVSKETIREVVSLEVLPALSNPTVDEVWFYGAGCAGKAMLLKVAEAVSSALPGVKVNVNSDLTGAARGLLGNRAGYICMIGTGSNSGYYDGKNIKANVPPLGFILGDEGSGAALGKKLIADFLRGIMPEVLADEFRAIYGAEKDEIVSNVYRGVFPSRYIGGFVKFLNDHIGESYCRELVETSFGEFVQRNLTPRPEAPTSELQAQNGIAYAVFCLKKKVFKKHGFVISSVSQGPIEGLIRYHKENL